MTLEQRTAGPHTRLALAVYRMSPTPPPGVGNGVITFRKQILDDSLLTARIGKRGQPALDVALKVPRGPLRWTDTCYGSGLWYTVAVNGHEILSSTCAAQSMFDPGTNGAVFDGNPLADYGIKAGDTARVRVWLHRRGHERQVAVDPDVVLGLGVHAHPAGRPVIGFPGQVIPANE